MTTRTGLRFAILIGAWLALGTILAMSLPDDVATRYPHAALLVEGFARWVPAIDRIARVSSFPEMARLFGAILWVSLPVGVVLCLKLPEQRTVVSLARRQAWRTVLIVPILAITMLLLFYFFPFDRVIAEPNSKFGHGPILFGLLLRSRFWLGLLGSGAFLDLALVLAAATRSFLLFRLILTDTD
jgi:hypothetical protein